MFVLRSCGLKKFMLWAYIEIYVRIWCGLALWEATNLPNPLDLMILVQSFQIKWCLWFVVDSLLRAHILPMLPPVHASMQELNGWEKAVSGQHRMDVLKFLWKCASKARRHLLQADHLICWLKTVFFMNKKEQGPQSSWWSLFRFESSFQIAFFFGPLIPECLNPSS